MPLHHSLRERSPSPEQSSGEELGGRIEDCSCPRGGHWRPGARWAKELPSTGARGKAPVKAARESKPLVTTHKIGNRIEIAAISPEAGALGLRPGMALAKARAMYREIDAVDADAGADAALLQSLALFAARRWTPRASLSGADGLWLDLDGVSHLFGGEAAMCRRILLFCARAGYAARIAVAGTAGAAHALARFGNAPLILCPAGGESNAIAPFPLEALRLEAEVLAAARQLGIETIGDLDAMPRAPLQRRFGRNLLRRFDQAQGRAAEPFDPIIPETPPRARLRFAEPIASAEAIGEALSRLIAELTDRLGKAHLGIRRLAWLCHRIDGDELQVAIGTARPSRDPRHLLRLLEAKIETIDPGFGIEAMDLVAARCEPLAPQAIHGELAGDRPAPDLSPLVDRLATRLGPGRLYRSSMIESDVPERSVRHVGPFDIALGWPEWPRPVRFLVPAEPVDNVIAELPDHPPRLFRWRGRLHRIRRGDGPERIYGEWWKRSGEADAVRDYFRVEDEEGNRFWLYRRGDSVDPRTGDLSWWLQGAFG
jgi:protein ImuB